MHENQSSVQHRTNTNGTSGEPKSDESTTSPPNKSYLMKITSYLIALRVWSLSASIIPTILGEWVWVERERMQPGQFPRARSHSWELLSQKSIGSPLKQDWCARRSSHVMLFTSWICNFGKPNFHTSSSIPLPMSSEKVKTGSVDAVLFMSLIKVICWFLSLVYF